MFKRFAFLLSSLVTIGQLSFAITINLEKEPPAKKKQKNFAGPVILDTRKAFEYSMGHVEKSVPVRWEDFSQTEDPHKGALDPDASLLARRLRVLGISPEREVVVLGSGVNGGGEEGRVAWMLKYLGVRKVSVLNDSRFKGKRVFGERPEVDEAAIWIPKPDEAIRARIPEMEKAVAAKSQSLAIVDVRNRDDFLSGHIPMAINIPWAEFVSSEDEPIKPRELRAVLTKHGIELAKELIFYSYRGVKSGYATFASLNAGLKARNFDGSMAEWTGNPRLPVEK